MPAHTDVQPAPRSTRRTTWLIAAALVAVTATTYAGVWWNGFIFDDELLIVHNVAVRAPLGNTRALSAYRPLRTLSYRLDYAVGGMNPRVFHVSNVAYHALTVLLVAAVLEAAGASLWGAAAGALFFAVHPVQTDAVSYAAGRRDVLCGLLYVAAFLAFLRWRVRPRALTLIAGATAAVLAILTKEMAITLPLVCVAYDRFARRRAAATAEDVSPARRPDGERTPDPASALRLWGALLALPIVLAFALTYGRFVRRVLAETPWHGGSIGANFATVARVWLHYLALLVWPAALSADYSYDAFPVSATALDPRALAAAVVLVVLGILAWQAWRRGSLAGFGAAWFAITLLPVSHLVPYRELLAEHYLYIPMLGVAAVIAAAVDAAGALVPARRRAFALVVLALAGAAATRTALRNRDWRDPLSLWSATVAAVPGCARAHYNLGQAYFDRVRLDDAEREWLAADAIRGGDFDVQLALATLYYRIARFEPAKARVAAAFALRPDEPRVQALAGWVALGEGRPQDAIGYFDAALPRLAGQDAKGAAFGQQSARDAIAKGDQTVSRLGR